MSASQTSEDQDVESSNTNLNSSSTQTTELQSDQVSTSSLPQRDAQSQLSPPPAALPAAPSSVITPPSDSKLPAPVPASSPLSEEISEIEKVKGVAATFTTSQDSAVPKTLKKVPSSIKPHGSLRTAEETVHFVTSLQSHRGFSPTQVESLNTQSGLTLRLGPNVRPAGFVSSEQLQEILQELSVDAIMETTLRSPGQASRASSQLKFPSASALSPLSLRTPRSPHPPLLFRFPSISPYAMRKRRPPFRSSRRGFAPSCFYTGSEASGCEGIRDKCGLQDRGKLSDGATGGGPLLQVEDSDLEREEEEEEDVEGNEAMKKCHRCVLRSHRFHTAPLDVEAGGENSHNRRLRDSCGFWDSDSSSSTDYCYYHRPYCDSCLQRGSLLSSDTSSDSDSEYEDYAGLYRSPHPVVFKEDLKPTFVWAQVFCTLHVVLFHLWRHYELWALIEHT